jgi:hypothetical protein
MKIAILYSGHFRSFLDVIENNNNKIINNGTYDYYLNFWDTWGHGNVFKEQVFCESDLIPNDIKNNINAKFVEFEKYEDNYEFNHLIKMQEFRGNANICSNVIRMFYKMERGYHHINNSGIHYDYILKLRPDNFLVRNIEFFEPEKNTLYTSLEERWNLSGWGMNDQFAFGDLETMKKYLTTYSSLKDIFTYHNCTPEIVLKTHLNNCNIFVKDFFGGNIYDGIPLHKLMREYKILD